MYGTLMGGHPVALDWAIELPLTGFISPLSLLLYFFEMRHSFGFSFLQLSLPSFTLVQGIRFFKSDCHV